MSEKCTYMTAAYPDLEADFACSRHRHEPRVFDLARALAVAFQPEPTTDERIAWFLDDADAVVDDFPADTAEWLIVPVEIQYDDDLGEPVITGVDRLFTVNGVEYVLPESDWEPAVPVKRAEWDSWHEQDDEEADRG